MDKLGDMNLFIRVIKHGGLAAGGRELGISPARVTARINALEKHYGVRLLTRTTRRVSLTDAGRQFYSGCERVLAELEQTEVRLQSGQETFAGPLRITTTSDLGQQHIAPLLFKFAQEHPDVVPYMHLSDGIVNVRDEGFDLAIRYGVLADSTMVSRKLADSRRVLCASPSYIKRMGHPKTPDELQEHHCLSMVRSTEILSTWHFQTASGQQSVIIQPSATTNDGALIRRWALDGAGIALKSYWDVAADIKTKRLVTVLDEYTQDFAKKGTVDGANLHVVYSSREFLPLRTRGFIDVLLEYFSELQLEV